MKKNRNFILLVVILSCLFTACGNISKDSSPSKSNVAKKSNSVESSKKKKYDEIVSVVDSYLKARLNRTPKKAASYCADSLKDVIYKDIKKLDTGAERLKSELMDSWVSVAEDIFYSVADDSNDIIDAEYLRDDDDMQKANNELVDFLCDNSIIYSLPKKAKMVSTTKATVKIGLTVRDTAEIEKTYFSDDITGYLEGIILDKIADNSNFIKREIAKKIMKETLISYINKTKSRYIKTTDGVQERTDTYHLKKKNGNWIITKIDKGNTE